MQASTVVQQKFSLARLHDTAPAHTARVARVPPDQRARGDAEGRADPDAGPAEPAGLPQLGTFAGSRVGTAAAAIEHEQNAAGAGRGDRAAERQPLPDPYRTA